MKVDCGSHTVYLESPNSKLVNRVENKLSLNKIVLIIVR